MNRYERSRPYVLVFLTGYFLNQVVYGHPSLNSTLFLSAMALLLIFKSVLWFLNRRDAKKAAVTPSQDQP